MRHLLFVDDEPHVLTGLKRMLHPFRREWEMEFVGSAPEALDRMSKSQFDVLITDLHMPGMSGVELLQASLERHPSVVRVVLSGTADRDATFPAVGLAHHYLVKPCDSELLRKTLNRVLVARFMPEGSGLQEFVKSVQSLPSLPTTCQDVLAALKTQDMSIREAGEAISRDVALTAKVLQLVNSAYFGLQRQIRNPIDAVVYLGTEVTFALVLTASVYSQYENKLKGVLQVAELRDHSVAVATLGRQIAKSMGIAAPQLDEVFTGGILHDVGELVLASHSPNLYRNLRASATGGTETGTEAELRIFGATHTEIGAYLLWLWGLPEVTMQIVARHHGPLPPVDDQAYHAIVAVRAAEALLSGTSDDNLDWLGQTAYASSLDEWRTLTEEYLSDRRLAC